MSAIEELRRAAETLRELAGAATDGPWRVCAEGSEGSRIAPAIGTPRERTRFIGILNGRVQPEDGRNARYIATMHPGVGGLLADWLEEVSADAESNEQHDGFDPYSTITGYGYALAVARVISGGDGRG